MFCILNKSVLLSVQKKKSDFSDVTLKESTLLCIFFYLMAKIALDYFKIIKFQSLKEYERRTQLNLD